MIEEFKQWLIEVQEAALDRKRKQARDAGDESTWKRFKWRNPAKNREIKTKFYEKGIERGYRARPTPAQSKRVGEWLYDAVWRKFDDNSNLLQIVLTVEIELSDTKLSGLRYDFHKLLQADSEYKIFVFQAKTKSEVLAAMEGLKKAAQHYLSKSTSEFLLCGWSTQLNQFLFDEFTQAVSPQLPSSQAEAVS